MKKCRRGEPGPHHWIIAPADGATSAGICQSCGWEKEFENTSVERDWASPASNTQAARARAELRRLAAEEDSISGEGETE